MSFSVAATLKEVRAEITRLQQLEKALVAAGTDGTDDGEKPSRVSPAGVQVIRLAARLRHLRDRVTANPKNAELKATVSRIEKELVEAKAEMAKVKAARRAK
jgi:hypothetical protein